MKKLILLLVLGLISFNLLSVISGESEFRMVELEIKKGWNLVPIFYPESIDPASEIQRNNLIAGYMYSPIPNSYTKILEKGGYIKGKRLTLVEEELFKIANQSSIFKNSDEVRNFMLTTSSWLYSNKDGKFITYIFRKGIPRIMLSGWNFVLITPQLMGKTLNDLKGDCDIIKAYQWALKEKGWDDIRMDNVFSEAENAIGTGMIIKVSNDCTLGETAVSPPSLPS